MLWHRHSSWVRADTHALASTIQVANYSGIVCETAPSVRFRVRIQPVDATVCLYISAGVLKSRVFDQGRDRAAAIAKEQITFPVTRHRTVFL
jgi:hypothetical protein